MMNNSANIVARANGSKGSYPDSSVEAQGMQVKNDGAQKRGRGFNRGRGANRGFNRGRGRADGTPRGGYQMSLCNLEDIKESDDRVESIY